MRPSTTPLTVLRSTTPARATGHSLATVISLRSASAGVVRLGLSLLRSKSLYPPLPTAVTNILHNSLNLGETEQGSGKCVGSLAAQDLGLGDGVFLLGDR